MQASSHVEDVIAAFYARVMQRVCVAYKELDARSNADVAALVEQKWRQRVACYAGFEFPDDVPSGLIPDASLGSTVEGHEIRRGAASEGQEEVAAETLVVADVLESASERMENNAMEREDVSSAAALAGAGHPAAQIMGIKRKISQLDGADDDDESDDIGKADGGATPPRDCGPLTTSNSDVVAVLAPVWGLPVSSVPTQLSARFSKFKYRPKQRDFYGKLSAIILTLTRPLVSSDIVLPGHLLWMHDERDADQGAGKQHGMVQVVRHSSAQLDDVHVRLADGSIVVVHKSCTQRFYEVIVAKGIAQFQSQH